MIRKLHLQIVMICLLLVGFSPSYGQGDLIKKANKQYDLKAFELASYNFSLALKEDPDNAEAIISLARCQAMMNNDLEATKLFSLADEKYVLTNEELIVFGKSLKKIADYKKAKDVFSIVKLENPVLGEHFLLSCDFAEKAMKMPLEYDISPFGGNTASSDFGVVSIDDSWVYTSMRSDIKEKEINSIPGSRLFSTGKISSKNTSSSLLRAPIRTSYRLGPISYSEDMSQCAIMRNNFKEGNKQVYVDDEEHSIVMAEVDMDGDFINERPFKHNEVGSSTAFPCFAFNGAALYFSSNRQGGYGGYDIYVSYLKGDEWSLPENLGPNINTQGNEITPFFDDHTLFFASDYLHGLGGYDIFKSIVYLGDWSFPENLGNGVNSPSDDMYPYMKDGNEIFYFSSNRLGGNGNLDIYSANKIGGEIISIISQEPQVPLASFVTNVDYMPKPAVAKTKENKKDYFSVDEEKELAQVTLIEESAIQNSDKPKAVKLPEANPASSSANWEGARMVAFDDTFMNGSKVYFIQLAALSRNVGDANRFRNLVKYGNIYKMNHSNLIKIRLGYFIDRDEAASVLKMVKSYGYSDAFITQQPLNTASMELMLSNSKGNTSDSYMAPSRFKGRSAYKVRLASYEDPIWFKIEDAKDLGKIEQWTKGGWTIFIASGYNTMEEAEKARVKAVNRGYADAEVVYDNNGILERLKKN